MNIYDPGSGLYESTSGPGPYPKIHSYQFEQGKSSEKTTFDFNTMKIIPIKGKNNDVR